MHNNKFIIERFSLLGDFVIGGSTVCIYVYTEDFTQQYDKGVARPINTS